MWNLFSNEILLESLGVFWYFGISNWTFYRVKGLYCMEVEFINLI